MTLERARELLRELERGDLAGLLEYADYGVYTDENVGWVPTTILLLRVPEPYAEAIEGLSDPDKQRIREAFEKVDPRDKAEQLSAEAVVHRELQPEQKLLGEIIAERNVLINVATGGKRIQEVGIRCAEPVLHELKAKRQSIGREGGNGSSLG